jgi:flagellar assembly protein FliH
MMSMSSNPFADRDPVTSFSYRDMGSPAPQGKNQDSEGDQVPKIFSDQEVKDLLHAARVQAASETEVRLRTEYDSRSSQESAKIRQAIELFQSAQKDYFSRVEREVVELVLAVAGKILHRETQVDPMLVAALVRVAIDKLHDGSSVTVRVPPAEAAKWRAFLQHPVNGAAIQVVEDAQLGAADCILETELGSANFSIEAQMKEIEQGFFDLLAQRPVIR